MMDRKGAELDRSLKAGKQSAFDRWAESLREIKLIDDGTLLKSSPASITANETVPLESR